MLFKIQIWKNIALIQIAHYRFTSSMIREKPIGQRIYAALQIQITRVTATKYGNVVIY